MCLIVFNLSSPGVEFWPRGLNFVFSVGKKTVFLPGHYLIRELKGSSPKLLFLNEKLRLYDKPFNYKNVMIGRKTQVAQVVKDFKLIMMYLKKDNAGISQPRGNDNKLLVIKMRSEINTHLPFAKSRRTSESIKLIGSPNGKNDS